MLCDVCGKAAATISYAEMIDGRLTRMNLCEKCARERGVGMSLTPLAGPLVNILMGLLEDAEAGGAEAAPGARCPQCGTTYEDFRRTGKLGCGACYEVFRDELKPLIRRIHGSTRHTGCATGAELEHASTVQKMRELRRELDRLVAEEEYEEAARVRDEIRALEQSQAEGE